jgi:hypothetical protein
VIAVLCLAAGVCAQDDKKYESKDGRFRATFPGTPKIVTKKAGDLDLSIVIVEKDKGAMAVIYSDLPAEKVKSSKPKDLLDGGEKGLVNNFKAKVTSSKDLEFGKEKYPARELRGERDNVHLRILIVLAGNRLYQVFIAGPKDVVNGEDADTLVKSFEITK